MNSEVKVPFGRITCLWLDCSQSLIFEIVINREIVNEFNWPPFWSVYASETGESYEYKLPLGMGGGVKRRGEGAASSATTNPRAFSIFSCKVL